MKIYMANNGSKDQLGTLDKAGAKNLLVSFFEQSRNKKKSVAGLVEEKGDRDGEDK